MTQEELIVFSCSVSLASNLRILASALQCASRIAKEVVLDASPDPGRNGTVGLRCVNDAKTSFLLFEFRQEFFDRPHEWGGGGETAHQDAIAVKISLKSVLSALRSLKSTERLEISLVAVGDSRNVVMFRAHCRYGIVKTHQFYYEDATVMDTDFDREGAAHHLRARPSLLIEAFQNIRGSDEVTLEVHAGMEMRLASFNAMVATEAPCPSSLVTEMRIKSSDFERFDVSEPRATLLFSLREFRAVLGFCEAHSSEIQDLSLLFNGSGDPLFFSTSSTATNSSSSSGATAGARAFPLYSFSLVLSTLPSIAAPSSTNNGND